MLAASASAMEIYQHRGETHGWNAKVKVAYEELTMQLRLLGTLPASDTKYLAGIAGCTVNFFVNHAWPRLAGFFLVEDGRLSHPDIERVSRPQLRVVPGSEPSPDVSAAKRAAANARWARRDNQTQEPAENAAAASPAASPVHAGSMQTDAENQANSMGGASVLHEAVHDFASAASGPARAASPPPNSLSSLSVPSDSLDRPGGGGGDAHAGEPVHEHAPEHAPSMQTPMQPPMQTDARADAGKPAKGGGKARPAAPPQTPLPPDWKPAEATAIEAKRLLRDAADDQLEKFVLTRRAKGETRADWDADFLAWCHRQVDFLARNPQAQKHMTMAIPGGRTEAAAKPAQPNPLDDPAAAVGPELGAQFVRVRNWLKFAVGPTDFAAHLVSMRFVGLDGDEVTVSLPSQFQADWARQHFGDKLLDGWQLQNPKISRVAFAVAPGDVRTATA